MLSYTFLICQAITTHHVLLSLCIHCQGCIKTIAGFSASINEHSFAPAAPLAPHGYDSPDDEHQDNDSRGDESHGH
jgi:hypothetical protein